MRTVEIAEATSPLSEYARDAGKGAIVVTRRGRPVAAVVPLRGVDLETLALSHSPDFIEIVRRSWASYEAEGGIPLEDIERELGHASKRARTSARRSARRAKLPRR